MRGYTQDKDAYLKRLRRIEGQVRGLQRMVEEDVYCIDVLTQVSAVTRALQAVALGLLEEHLGHCVTEAVRAGGDEGRESVREAAEAISRLVKSWLIADPPGPPAIRSLGEHLPARPPRPQSLCRTSSPLQAPPAHSCSGSASRAKARRLARLSPRLTRHAHSLRIEEAKPIARAGSKFSSE